jgi:hypothetical protein
MRRFGPLSNGNRCTGEVVMAICRARPNLWNAVLSSSELSNEQGKLKAGFWSARVRPTGSKNEFESIRTFSVNVEIGRDGNGQWAF